MPWSVEYTNEFGAWWTTLGDGAQENIAAVVTNWRLAGRSSVSVFVRHQRLASRAYAGVAPAKRRRAVRVFYAFDPRRAAILLIGGNKAGDDRFYERMIPLADRLYDDYIAELRREGLIPKD